MSVRPPGVLAALAVLGAQPEVAAGVAAAREACSQLRWHPALRRRSAEARAEATIRAARCSAALAGARFPLHVVRDAARGAIRLPDDAAGRTATGALRALSAAAVLEPTLARVPAQALARLHVAAAAGWLPDEALGRPRRPGEQPQDGAGPAPEGAELSARLTGLVELISAPERAPALIVAALVHAEVVSVRPFLAGNGVVGRALARAVIVARGLDPTAVAVWEAGHLAAGPGYQAALAGYVSRDSAGVQDWLLHCAQAVLDGAAEGQMICEAVLLGRVSQSDGNQSE